MVLYTNGVVSTTPPLSESLLHVVVTHGNHSQRYRFHPKVKRIARHRHLPKMVYKAAKEKRVMMAAQKRKRENIIKHSKPGAVKIVPERQKHVVRLVE